MRLRSGGGKKHADRPSCTKRRHYDMAPPPPRGIITGGKGEGGLPRSLSSSVEQGVVRACRGGGAIFRKGLLPSSVPSDRAGASLSALASGWVWRCATDDWGGEGERGSDTSIRLLVRSFVRATCQQTIPHRSPHSPLSRARHGRKEIKGWWRGRADSNQEIRAWKAPLRHQWSQLSFFSPFFHRSCFPRFPKIT